MRAITPIGLCIVAGLIGGLAGCRSTAPVMLLRTPATLDNSPTASPPALSLEGDAPVTLEEAIRNALRTDSGIHARVLRYRRAAGDLAGIQPESPEIRAGYDTNHDRREGWSSRQAYQYVRQWEDSLSLELRITPPNPWQLQAERNAGRADRSIAQADLLAREQDLACDIVEASLKMLYFQRMLKLQTAFATRALRVRTEVQDALDRGNVTSSDYAEARRLSDNALTTQYRMEARLSEIERDLRLLTGIDPLRLELEALRRTPLLPFPMPEPAGDEALAASLAAEHPTFIGSHWGVFRSEAESREASVARVPWIRHLASGYAWREGERTGGSQSESRETGTTRSIEDSGDENDGHEWWVGVGVDLPVFEWLSSESRLRRMAVTYAREYSDRMASRVHGDIVTTLRTARRRQAELERTRQRFKRELPSLQRLATTAKNQGLAGAIEALRAQSAAVDMAAMLADVSLREALGRLDFLRASGLSPVIASAPTTDSASPLAIAD